MSCQLLCKGKHTRVKSPHLFPGLSMELPWSRKAFILQSSCKRNSIPLPSPCSLLQDSDKWPTLDLGECLSVVVQSLSHVQLLVTWWTAACQAFLSFTSSWFNQTHVHWVGDAIQPSHPMPPSSFPFSLSQHQGLFQWVNSSHQVAKVLELQLQCQSFQWIFRIDFL